MAVLRGESKEALVKECDKKHYRIIGQPYCTVEGEWFCEYQELYIEQLFWYRVEGDTIVKRAIERPTLNKVYFYDENRPHRGLIDERKRCKKYAWFETKDEAIQHVLFKAEHDRSMAKNLYDKATDRVNKIKNQLGIPYGKPVDK